MVNAVVPSVSCASILAIIGWAQVALASHALLIEPPVRH